MSTQKVVYILWSARHRDASEKRRRLLEVAAPAILDAGVAGLQMNIADELARVRSPSPGVPFEEPICAQVNVWLEDLDGRLEVEDLLRAEGFELAGYAVEEQIYTEYGGNEHSRPRHWRDGERSPGLLSVTLLERPARLSREEWIRRWHGRQSPMSEEMQPRTRYVRNVVLRPLTPGAPPFEGVVEESWPSEEHVKNPFLFYGAETKLELLKNMGIMLHSVTRFLDLWRIRNVMMSEYFLKTEPSAYRGTVEVD